MTICCAAITALPMDAVCCDPPASTNPGKRESPWQKRTRSTGSPSRAAVTCVCAVAVPMPISWAATSTVT